MFIRNKYLVWYEKLCSVEFSGKDSHVHHILPKSLGGTDDPKKFGKAFISTAFRSPSATVENNHW